ncbi:hypothetical protein L1275_000743 [Flavobacterium sp. HSC-61S13]|nr:hypothetical protein [Flavobacterium sp. HSC-61S13]
MKQPRINVKKTTLTQLLCMQNLKYLDVEQ